MDSVDMLTEQSLRTLIKDVINEIIESAIEKALTAIENNNATDKDTVVDEVKVIDEETLIEENTVIKEETVIKKEFEIEEPDKDSVVETIVEELVLSVCQSSTGGGDEAEDSPAPTPVAVDMINTNKKYTGDSAEKAVADQISQSAEGAEVKNTFGDVVVRIDTEVIPAAQDLAPPKRKRRLAVAWRGIKRLFLCGCCSPRGK